MIVIFGPAGAGKSMQGQILAARHGWRWLSTGQLLRDAHDVELTEQMQTGDLLSDEKVNVVIAEALSRAGNIDRVILDGYPRHVEQARWLLEAKTSHGRAIGLVIVLEVPTAELLQRLAVRGRVDDTPETIQKRLRIYRKEMYPVLAYFNDHNIVVAHIDGHGSVGTVHDRIEAELSACKLV